MNAANEFNSSTRIAGQYLSFSIANEEFAVDILRVQEIRGICPLTPLPQSPPELRGVMNLRGAVVPVVDLRAALGFECAPYDKFSVIVVLSIQGRTVGFVVDGVSDVLTLAPESIEQNPDFAGRLDASLISGIARAHDRFVILLDVERVTNRDLPQLSAA